MTAEPPTGWSLELADGARRRVPASFDIPPDYPVYVADGTGGVSLSMVGE